MPVSPATPTKCGAASDYAFARAKLDHSSECPNRTINKVQMRLQSQVRRLASSRVVYVGVSVPNRAFSPQQNRVMTTRTYDVRRPLFNTCHLLTAVGCHKPTQHASDTI